MKKLSFIAAAAGMFICTAASAQTKVYSDSITDFSRHSYQAQVIQSSGRSIGSVDLQRMGTRNINNIANTVSGVQSIDGSTPNIRGAGPAGTAYFVDGVRVYGSLPKY